jgi:radical SAM protein with 4Fe4S-binding SPASM domain
MKRNPLARPVNALCSGSSFLAGILWGSTTAHGMPPAAGIELTNYCNLSCPECNSGSGIMTRNRGYMEISLFERIISELGPFLYNINLYFQGESMMHPRFFEILSECRHVHSTLSTNGHFLTPENSERIVSSGLGKLIISLDGMDVKTYSLYRVNGNFETVIKGIRNVSEARKRIDSRLKLVIQFLVNRHNESQIGTARTFAAEMDASLELKSMQIITGDFGSWLPSSGKFSRYREERNGYVLRNALANRCARLWFNPVITWDGKVLPCCFDKDAEHIMGDLSRNTFREIWNGHGFRAFRNQVRTGRKKIGICRNCTSGTWI